jgi:hypothetical protein
MGTENFQKSNSEPESLDDAVETLVASLDSPSMSSTDQPELFLTSFGPIPPGIATEVTNNLANRSFVHAIISTDLISSDNADVDPFVYTTVSRYTPDKFYEVVIDTGASKQSTVGYGQYIAYNKIHDTPIDTTRAGFVNVQFGIGSTPSIGSIIVDTPVGRIEFHAVYADTPFFLCLADIDALQVYYNNLSDTLVTLTGSFPVLSMF